MGYEIVITFNESGGLADGMGTVSTQPAEQHPEGLTGNDPADPTTPTSVQDVESDAVRTPEGEPDGELIDPATLPPVEPGSEQDESSEEVRPA